MNRRQAVAVRPDEALDVDDLATRVEGDEPLRVGEAVVVFEALPPERAVLAEHLLDERALLSVQRRGLVVPPVREHERFVALVDEAGALSLARDDCGALAE